MFAKRFGQASQITILQSTLARDLHCRQVVSRREALRLSRD